MGSTSELGQSVNAVLKCYAHQATPPSEVRDLDAWRAKVAIRCQQRHTPQIQVLLMAFPEATPEMIARAVWTQASPHEIAAQIEHEQVAEAGRALAERAHARFKAGQALPSFDGSHVDGIAEARRHLDDPDGVL